MIKSILKDVKIVIAKTLTAAGYGDVISSSAVSMSGFGAVLFSVSPTVIATGGIATATVYGSDDGTNYYALTGASVISSGDSAAGKNILIEVLAVKQPYVMLKVARTVANVTLSPITAMLFQAKECPITADSSVDGSVQVAYPEFVA